MQLLLAKDIKQARHDVLYKLIREALATEPLQIALAELLDLEQQLTLIDNQ